MKLISVRWACLLVLLVSVFAVTSAVSAEQGRWKVDGDGNCYFEANDDGPDQCLPPNPAGRWKVDGAGNCYFEQNDQGPDQCVPPATEPEAPAVEPAVTATSIAGK